MVSSASSDSSSSSEATAVLDGMKQTPTSPRVSTSLYDAIMNVLYTPLYVLYYLYQRAIIFLFAGSSKPRPAGVKPNGRIAVVGGGLTGIASAAHAVAHGFEVVIYESNERVGGIWAQVNSTSGLQLNSLMYRFHPSIFWKHAYPRRNEIVGEIEGVWKKYHLEDCTRFKTKVTKITRHPNLSTDPKKGGHGRWVINSGEDGIFDAVIMAVGTCGKAKMASFPGQNSFTGQILHSSQLDDADLTGKRVVIIGSGASGVEAAELAVEKKASNIVLLARDDKWIIPRNTLFDIFLALQPFGREMPLSFIPEWFIRTFHYRDQAHLSPARKGLFEGTPIVNSEFLGHIRQGKISYKRGDTLEITSQGVKFSERGRSSHPGDQGHVRVETADVLVYATGFDRPSIDMLPKDLFPQEGDRSYQRPSLYLQNFSTEDWSILLTNSSYTDAIGSVGNWHIGLYTRVLLLFLLNEPARPSPKGMKLWVDLLNWLKLKTFTTPEKASSLAFFTYTELCLWIVTFHFFNLLRLPWIFFTLFGWGVQSNKTAPKLLVKDRA